ncbi:hypothetical protein C2S51_034006 [Perilla frutescens var. frutescens]|nr:hypothetical protein C2S51_034006 [Perilla frutescens var. frutescens]
MCSEIDRFSSFLRRMSGSDNPKILPVEKKEGAISSESHPQDSETAAEERERENLEADHQNKPDEEIKSEDEPEPDKATASHRESEDDDGFKTPTSSDHRIPAITQCPPAPKKFRPPPSKLKRKAASPPASSRSIELDSSAEVESIFCPIVKDQDDTQQHKIKKPRTDDKDRS